MERKVSFVQISFFLTSLTFSLSGMSALSLSTNHATTTVNREHEKQVLEGVLPPDLRHLVRGGSPSTIQVVNRESATLSSKSFSQ